MYVPKYFEDAADDGLETIRAYPFATLTTPGDDGLPLITHTPMLADEESQAFRLIGHVARANPHARNLSVGGPAVAVFNGPNAYISPNWYPSKHAGKEAVPTWNYVAVHAIGTIRPLADYADKRRVVRALSIRFEGDGPSAWRLDDEPEDFVRKMLGGIVAFALDVERLESKAKLSQNRTASDRVGVIEGLKASDTSNGREVAAAMALRGLDGKENAQ